MNARYRSELNDEGRLSAEQLRKALNHMITERERFEHLESYYYGENAEITHRARKKGFIPVPIPYGRRIVQTVTGYMFKPEYISYESDNEPYKAQLDEILYDNHDDVITPTIGKHLGIYGVAYEVHFVGDDANGRPTARYVVINPKEMLAVYSHDLSIERPIAAIRWTTIDDVQHVDVYYNDIVVNYTRGDSGVVNPSAETDHMYGAVPVVEYENNEERQGDFEAVVPLIDAYDILASDMVHEVDKIAEAYLVLTNHTIAEDDADRLRYKRIIELMEGGKAEFLVKNLNADFTRFMREFIREEIHQQSQIPDMTDMKFGGQQSGVAMRYKLYDLETVASTKEPLVRRGIYDRFRLIDAIADILWGDIGTVRDINITFTRNVPMNYLEIAQIVAGLRGHVSHQTILAELVPFVDNAAEEMERLAEESDPLGMFDDTIEIEGE